MAAIRSARAARAVQEALAVERKGLAAGLAARRPAADIAAGGYMCVGGGGMGAAGAAGSCAGMAAGWGVQGYSVLAPGCGHCYAYELVCVCVCVSVCVWGSQGAG